MQAAAAQVVAGRTGRRIVEQPLVVPLDGRGHRLDEPLAALPFGGLARRRVVQLHPGLGGEVLDGADEVDVAGPWTNVNTSPDWSQPKQW